MSKRAITVGYDYPEIMNVVVINVVIANMRHICIIKYIIKSYSHEKYNNIGEYTSSY